MLQGGDSVDPGAWRRKPCHGRCAKRAWRGLDQPALGSAILYRVASTLPLWGYGTKKFPPAKIQYEIQIIIDESMIDYCKSGISGVFLFITDGS